MEVVKGCSPGLVLSAQMPGMMWWSPAVLIRMGSRLSSSCSSWVAKTPLIRSRLSWTNIECYSRCGALLEFLWSLLPTTLPVLHFHLLTYVPVWPWHSLLHTGLPRRTLKWKVGDLFPKRIIISTMYPLTWIDNAPVTRPLSHPQHIPGRLSHTLCPARPDRFKSVHRWRMSVVINIPLAHVPSSCIA